jgi:hypothetical protein
MIKGLFPPVCSSACFRFQNNLTYFDDDYICEKSALKVTGQISYLYFPSAFLMLGIALYQITGIMLTV